MVPAPSCGNHPPTSTYHNGRKKCAESCSIGYIVRSWRPNPPINIFNHEPENWVWLKPQRAHNQHDIVCYVLSNWSQLVISVVTRLDFNNCFGWVVQTPIKHTTYIHIYIYITYIDIYIYIHTYHTHTHIYI